MTHTSTEQPEALAFANDRPKSVDDDLYQWAIDAEAMIRLLHADNEALKKVICEAQIHIKDAAYTMAFKVLHSAHGITQEKQG